MGASSAGLTRLLLVAVCVLLARGYEPQYGTDWQVAYNDVTGYRVFTNTEDTLYFSQELNFDAVPGSIIAGAADRLYQLSLELVPQTTVSWPESPQTTFPACFSQTTENTNLACRNHIRVYRRIPSQPSWLLVCGTWANQTPRCTTVDISSGNVTAGLLTAVNVPSSFVSHFPEFPSFGDFVSDPGSPPNSYISASYSTASKVFELSVQDVSFSNPADPSTLSTSQLFTTLPEDYWLDAPVTFVSLHRADYPPSFPATLPEHYQFYLLFLRENFFSFDDPTPAVSAVYSRVVRVCRNDQGSSSTGSGGQRYFTTFLKARIFCEREVPPGRQFSGSNDYQYNEISSTVFNEEGRFVEGGAWRRLMYGAFSGPSVGPVGTAVCVYRADNDAFNNGIFDVFREDIRNVTRDPVTGAVTTSDIQNMFLECVSGGRSDEAAEDVEIVRDIRQLDEDPLLVIDGISVTQMAVDRVCVVSKADPSSCSNQDVLFLGTSRGRVLKVVFGLEGNDGAIPVVAEEIELEDTSAVNELRIEEVDSVKQLFVSTQSAIYRLPLQRCDRHTQCSDCIGSRDPHCVWNTTGLQCKESALSASEDLTGTVPSVIVQNIHTGVVEQICDFPEIGLLPASYEAGEGSGSVEVVVMTTVPGGNSSGLVELSTVDGTARAGEDYEATVETVIFPPGQSQAVISVPLLEDSTVEGPEQFTVALRDLRTGGVVVTQDNASVTISDNDVVTVEFQAMAVTVSEGSSFVNISVTKSGSSVLESRVRLSTMDNTATAPENYLSADMELSFAPNESESFAIVTLVDNDIHEGNRTFDVVLSRPEGEEGVAVGGGGSLSILLTDDDVVSVQLSSAEFSVPEGAGCVAIAATKTGQTLLSVSARLSFTDQTANAGSDYDGGDVMLTFAPGDSELTACVPVTNDSVHELQESFLVAVVTEGSQPGVEIGAVNEATVYIRDDDVVELELSVSGGPSVTEGDGPINLSVSRVGPSQANITFSLNTVDGSAVSPGDFSAVSGSFLLAASETSVQIEVAVVGDELLETSEHFLVQLSLPSSSSSSQQQEGVLISTSAASANITITDDDTVSFSFASVLYSADESDCAVQVEILKSGNSDIQTQVLISTTDITATGGVDYSSLQQVPVVFAPQESSKTVTVVLRNDEEVESDESFSLFLERAGEGTLLGQDSSTTITILDDDSVIVGFSCESYTTSEGVEGGELSVAITLRGGASSLPIVLQLAAVPATAAAPEDFTAPSPEVELLPGQSEVLVRVGIAEDGRLEGTETFNLTLSSSQDGVSVQPASATVTILDNDAVSFALESSSFSVAESAGAVNVTVTKSGSAAIDTSVSLRTITGTARAAVDYVETNTVVQFSPSSSSATVSIALVDDSTLEGLEAFSLLLVARDDQMGVALPQESNSTATVEITDDDAVSFSFASVLYSADESACAVEVEILKSDNADIQIQVLISTTDITATGGVDYTSLQQVPVVFAPQESSKTVAVVLRNDEEVESDESFSVFLERAGEGTLLGQDSSTTITILNDDSVIVGFSCESYTTSEGVAGGELSVAITLRGGASSLPIVLQLAAVPATAAAPEDFTAPSPEVELLPGQSELLVRVGVAEDGRLEGTETFNLTLSSSQDGVSVQPASATVTILDNDAVSFALESSSFSVAESAGAVNVTVTKSGSAAIDTSVSLRTIAGTARAAVDYVETNMVVQFSPSSSSATVSIALVDDSTLEGLEAFSLLLVARDDQMGVALPQESNSTATVEITDDDAVSFSFASVLYSADESACAVEVEILKSGNADIQTQVLISTTDITTTGGVDYTSLQQVPVVFAPQESSKTVTVVLRNDEEVESDESFSVFLERAGEGTLLGQDSSTTITILNDDSVIVGFSCESYTTSEGVAGGELSVAITLRGGASSLPIVLQLAAVPATAAAPEDFTAPSPEVELLPGQSEVLVRVGVTEDGRLEGTETFNLTLSSSQDGVSVQPASATVTILDNDAVSFALESSSFSVAESASAVNVTVAKSGSAAIDTSVSLRTIAGTARAAVDYVETNTVVQFSPNSSSATVSIALVDDSTLEGLEAFSLLLVARDDQMGVALPRESNSTATVEITDDDAVSFSFASVLYSADESACAVEVEILKSGNADIQTQVLISTTDITATGGVDYSSLQQVPVVFGPQESSKTVIVVLRNDEEVESDESFSVFLERAGEGTLLGQDNSTTITILDEDVEPTECPTAAATTSQAATTSSAVFPTEGTFTISQGLEQPCTIYASTSAATAVLVVLLAVIAVLLLVVVLLLCAVCSLHRRRRDTRKLADARQFVQAPPASGALTLSLTNKGYCDRSNPNTPMTSELQAPPSFPLPVAGGYDHTSSSQESTPPTTGGVDEKQAKGGVKMDFSRDGELKEKERVECKEEEKKQDLSSHSVGDEDDEDDSVMQTAL